MSFNDLQNLVNLKNQRVFTYVTGFSKNIFAFSTVRVASAGDAVYAARQIAVALVLLFLRSERVLETLLGVVIIVTWHLQLCELVLGVLVRRVAVRSIRLSLLLESFGFGFLCEALGFFLLLSCLLEGGLGLFLFLAAAFRLFGGFFSFALLFGLDLPKTFGFGLSCSSCLGILLLFGEACGFFSSDSLPLHLFFFCLEPSGFLLRFDAKAFLFGLLGG